MEPIAQRVSRAARRTLHAAAWPAGFALALYALPMGSLGAAEPAAMRLLVQMATALRTTDYQGSFIYERGGGIDSLRIFHAGGPHERERLISLSGPRSEVVRNGASITWLQPGAPTVLLPNRGARLLPLVPDPQGAFSRFYQVSLGKQDRVAGFGAQVVDIAPVDSFRYGYRLWLEDTTHLLLRSEVFDGANRTLEQFMFAALDIGARPTETDLAASGAAGIAAAPEEQSLAGAPHWRIADAPAGFVFLRAQRPTQGPQEAEHQLHTDGVAYVSVYIEPDDRGVRASIDHAATRGVLNIYTHAAAGWKFTALGDVPRATVARMARSVELAKPIVPAR